MKKNILLVFVAVFLLASFVSAYCTDYDGRGKYTASYTEGTGTSSYFIGKTLNMDGTVTNNGLDIHIRYDRCILGGTQVQEAKCLTYAGRDNIVYTQFFCENGCENGACIEEGVLISNPYYSDLDGDSHNSFSQSGTTTNANLPTGSSFVQGDDCNDADPEVYPGNIEVCDGKDNNCDNVIDEGCGECTSGQTTPCGTDAGLCQIGSKDCINGNWGTCTGAIYPEEEICDSLDHNCDESLHLTNAGIPINRATTCGVGLCLGNQGQQTCTSTGSWGTDTCNPFYGASTEVCNDDSDNDCDGLTDCSDQTDCSTSPYCTGCECTLEGECNPTNNGQKCDGCNYYSVSNANETCDLIDDNCDGSLTEFPLGVILTQPTNCGFGSCLNSGFEFCQLNGSFGGDSCEPLPTNYTAEMNCSDGIDEDCDGLMDCEDTEDCGLAPECGGCECTSGCHSSTPRYICDGCNYVEALGGDVCDGEDNDCDGIIDEGEDGNLLWTECYTGSSNTLGLGECTYGFSYCIDGEYGDCMGQQLPSIEICTNGFDDSCNGLTDCDDEDACFGMLGCELCVEGECNPNNNGKVCVNGQYVNSNEEEVCDGLDNDCDGAIDEGEGGVALSEECYLGDPITQGVGECSAGTTFCIAGAYGGCLEQVLPEPEICDNGLDDDCNGIDDDCGCVDVDGDSFGIENLELCNYLTLDCNDNNANINPGALEDCSNNLDDDCNGEKDCADGACEEEEVCLEGEYSGSPPIWNYVINTGGSVNPGLIIINSYSRPEICRGEYCVPLSQEGDYVGVFFDGYGEGMKAGGADHWQDAGIIFSAFGNIAATNPVKDGFEYAEYYEYRLYSHITGKDYIAEAIEKPEYPSEKWYPLGFTSLLSLTAEIDHFDAYIETSSDYFCEGSGEEVTLSAEIFIPGSGDYSYEWFKDGESIGTDQTISVQPSERTTYNLEVLDNGESYISEDDILIKMTNLPSVNAGQDGFVCENAGYALSGAALSYDSVYWTTSGDGSFENENKLSTVYYPGSDDVTQGIMTLTLHAVGCGQTVEDSLQVTFQTTPTIDLTGNIEEVCGGTEVIQLVSDVSGYSSLEWSSSHRHGNGYVGYDYGSFEDNTVENPIFHLSSPRIPLNFTLKAYPEGSGQMAEETVQINFLDEPYVYAGTDANFTGELGDYFQTTPNAHDYVSIKWSAYLGTGSFDNETIENPKYYPSADDISNGQVRLSVIATVSEECGSLFDWDRMNLYFE